MAVPCRRFGRRLGRRLGLSLVVRQVQGLDFPVLLHPALSAIMSLGEKTGRETRATMCHLRSTRTVLPETRDLVVLSSHQYMTASADIMLPPPLSLPTATDHLPSLVLATERHREAPRGPAVKMLRHRHHREPHPPLTSDEEYGGFGGRQRNIAPRPTGRVPLQMTWVRRLGGRSCTSGSSPAATNLRKR